MKRLLVYADFDRLSETELMGELCHETLRGDGSYSFKFAYEWLARHGDLF